MLARTKGAARHGVDARIVDVEVDVAARGACSFRVVGLSPSAARGLEERVRAALRNAGLEPASSSVTVNLAPASLPKEGPPLDLALAAALLAAGGVLPAEAAATTLLFGELSLDGTVRPAPGALAAAEAARRAGLRRLACAPQVAGEAAAVGGPDVHPVEHLLDAVSLLRGDADRPPSRAAPDRAPPAPHGLDLLDVRGQVHARRALEVAAAGAHGLLLVGPPGAGKSMLARRLPGLLPDLTREEAVEVTRIHSAAGLLMGDGTAAARPLVERRPFRAPHHSISGAGLIGGGRMVSPGEATLAHHGALFLDELPEFRRDALEALRQPLEDGAVTIVRASDRATLPCRFVLVAAMNPCVCGYLGSRLRECTCTHASVARYRARLSGPLLDRLDLHVEVPSLTFAEISSSQAGESTASVRERVARAHEIQRARQRCMNSSLAPGQLRKHVRLTRGALQLLERAVDRLGISARAHDRALRVAVTIKDLADACAGSASTSMPVQLAEAHVGEALSYRMFDRTPTMVRMLAQPEGRAALP